MYKKRYGVSYGIVSLSQNAPIGRKRAVAKFCFPLETAGARLLRTTRNGSVTNPRVARSDGQERCRRTPELGPHSWRINATAAQHSIV